MSHLLYGRLICDARTKEQARAIYQRVEERLEIRAALTVCEPFVENDAYYDLVFETPLSAQVPPNLIAWFEGLLEKIDGDWQEKMLTAYRGSRYQCSAVLDNYADPQHGIAWMSLALTPA